MFSIASAAKIDGVLRDDADRIAQRAQIEVPDFDAVQRDGALLRVVEAQQQLE